MVRGSRRASAVITLVLAGLTFSFGAAVGQGSPAPSDFDIVGEWLGLQDCERIVPMFRDAGLDEFVLDAVVGNALIPGVSDPTTVDPSEPCIDAVPRSHSHFFTASGEFGSRDYTGSQVDDGPYSVDGDTLTINDATFRYSVRGDALTMEPQLTADCATQECRGDNSWRLMVSMPGMIWVRVP
jgi:hypothetical protein